jgi:hypothetical protein
MALKDQREPLRFPRTNGASALGQAEQLAQPRANLITLLRKRAAMLARNEHATEGHRPAAHQQPKASTDETRVPEHPGALVYPPGLQHAFQEAISDIHRMRGTKPTNGAYAHDVQDLAWRTFLGALVDSCSAVISEHHPECSWARNNPLSGNMHVLASGPGSGKSTLAKAFAVALTREADPEPYPLGCVFLVHHIATAEAVFRELKSLLPQGSVAVFTTKHDADSGSAAYSDTFGVHNLEKHAVLVTTQEFYMGIRGEHARYFTRGDLRFPRVLTFIDERVNEIAVYDVDPLSLETVLKFIQQDHLGSPELLLSVIALWQFTSQKRLGKHSIETSAHDKAAWQGVVDATQYLRSEDAARYARSAAAREPAVGFDAVFGFANAMAEDRAFIARQNKGLNSVNFVGYERALPRLPGMVLLDATADIDGISEVCRWRKHAKTPPERFDRLEVVHVPSVAKENLKRWLKEPANLRTYVQQIHDLIQRHVAPGQKALVVCTKDVVAAKDIANWSEHMVPFLHRTRPEDTKGTVRDTEFTNDFAWSFENRQIVVTWFGGYGIGANVWRDADVAIICDDFYLPQRAIKATLQGLRGHKATLLADADDAKGDELEGLRDGHILRWMKQMALRGKAREMDENGVCGHQKLVITGDLLRLLGHRPKVFPGAKITTERGEHGQWLDRLVCLLLQPGLPDEFSTKAIGVKLGVHWGNISSNLRRHKLFEEVIESAGWRYHRSRGQTPACFRRIKSAQARLMKPALADETHSGELRQNLSGISP